MLFPFGHLAWSCYRPTLLVQVAPNRIQDVGDALSGHPQTSWVAAITGSANIAAAVTFRDSQELFRYVTDEAVPCQGSCTSRSCPS